MSAMLAASVRRARILCAEALGCAFLLAIVVGSGIMGERLAAGNAAIALLANSVATGAGLYALIVTFASVCGAHFNPAVSLLAWWNRKIGVGELSLRVVAQCGGAAIGVSAAHMMFSLPLVQLGTRHRSSTGEIASEVIATTLLLLVIQAQREQPPHRAATAIALTVTSAYWFTASTAFANPAVTLARTLTDTFASISPASAPAFVLAQMVAAAIAISVGRWMWPTPDE